MTYRGMCVSREDAACYRLYAANCLEMAEHADATERKLFLLRIAQGWVKLADQIEKQSSATDGEPGVRRTWCDGSA
jgi:hypothetical protein